MTASGGIHGVAAMVTLLSEYCNTKLGHISSGF